MARPAPESEEPTTPHGSGKDSAAAYGADLPLPLRHHLIRTYSGAMTRRRGILPDEPLRALLYFICGALVGLLTWGFIGVYVQVRLLDQVEALETWPWNWAGAIGLAGALGTGLFSLWRGDVYWERWRDRWQR